MPAYFIRSSNAKSALTDTAQSKSAAIAKEKRMKKAGYKDAHIEQTTKGNGGYWFGSKTR